MPTAKKKATPSKPKRLSGAARTARAKKVFLEKLKKHKGHITLAAQDANVGRRTVYDWVDQDEDFAEQMAEVEESMIDHVESKLQELIDGVTLAKEEEGELKLYEQPPCKTSIIFYLKTKGKARGYIEKQEVDLNHVKGITLEVVDGPQVIGLNEEDQD